LRFLRAFVSKMKQSTQLVVIRSWRASVSETLVTNDRHQKCDPASFGLSWRVPDSIRRRFTKRPDPPSMSTTSIIPGIAPAPVQPSRRLSVAPMMDWTEKAVDRGFL